MVADIDTRLLDDIIAESLDLHARRLQRVQQPDEITRLRLNEARPDDWRRVVGALAPFVKEKRLQRLQRVLRQRRPELHLVVENVADPFNSQSLLRTAEGLGVQHVHVVEAVCEFQLPAAEAFAASRGPGGATSQSAGEGAARWVSIHKYRSSDAALAALQARGLRVFVSDCPTATEDEGEQQQRLPPEPQTADARMKLPKSMRAKGWQTAASQGSRGGPIAQPIDALDFGACTAAGGRGAALVFGNERRGCSRVFTEGADASFYLPMSGFTQSFNIGVALAMSLGAAVDSGAFPPGTLTEDERAELLGRWLMRDMKAAGSLLLQVGLDFADF